MKKKEFVYAREEISCGKTRFGTPVFDGISVVKKNFGATFRMQHALIKICEVKRNE